MQEPVEVDEGVKKRLFEGNRKMEKSFLHFKVGDVVRLSILRSDLSLRHGRSPTPPGNPPTLAPPSSSPKSPTLTPTSGTVIA